MGPLIRFPHVYFPLALASPFAGADLSRYVGFELTGKDLMDLTATAGPSLRYAHSVAAISTSCGVDCWLPLNGAFNSYTVGESVCLPFVRRATDDVVLVSVILLRARRRMKLGEVAPVEQDEKFRFFDIGFGLPRGREELEKV